MRLIHRTDPRANRAGAMDSNSAQALVGKALRSERHRLKGLDQLGYYGQFPRDADIVDAVRRGEWVLLEDEPALVSSGGFKRQVQEPEERPVYIKEDRWPLPKPREDLVFAKSCEIRNWGRTCEGREVESAEHFGSAMLCGAVAIPASATTAINAGAETALARIAGGGILQRGYTWALRGLGAASSPASLFILGMLPARLNDDTFYDEDRLRTLDRARTRVRFQIRRDADGALQVHGIHTGPGGDDHVRTVKAERVGNDRVMEAHLNGLTILWTPNKGEGPIPPLIYPEHLGKQLDNILVHPIAPDTASQIEIYPGSEDITTDDFILTFPANSGMRAMYVVYSTQLPLGHNYHSAPKRLEAFPEARATKRKTSVSGGGGMRKRWKDAKGNIYEWDSEHGAVEKYDKRGNHLGEFDHLTGIQTKSAESKRRVEP